MKNGIPEFKKDGEMLMHIYMKIDSDGLTRSPLTVSEEVLLFSLARWMMEKGETK